MTKRLGERLVEAGLVASSAVEQALAHQRVTGGRLGDCLVELGLISETTLLRFLAQSFKTRFVSAEKLVKAKIAPEALRRVPVRMCEKQDFLPLAYDAERRLLSVVMATPQDEALVKEIALVTESAEVFAYIGVRSVIQAAIRRHYYGDPTAFSALDQRDVQALKADVAKVASAYEANSPVPQPAAAAEVKRAPAALKPVELEVDTPALVTNLASALEAAQPEAWPHVALVTRLARRLARQLDLSPAEVGHVTLAAALHEVCKPAGPHLILGPADDALQVRPRLEALNVRALAPAVRFALEQQLEPFDGRGPLGLRGELLSWGARLIALSDAVADLMHNPKNAFARLLPAAEAQAWAQQHAGSLFDPLAVEALGALFSKPSLKQRIERGGRTVVIAHDDVEQRLGLAEALSQLGIDALPVSRLESLLDVVRQQEADAIVVALSYGVTDLAALLKLIRTTPASAPMPVLVWGEPTEPAGRERLVQAGVSALLPSSALPKVMADTIHAALTEASEHGAPARIIEGRLLELPLPELLGLLLAAKRSGAISITLGRLRGQLQIDRGRLLEARWGALAGEAALQALLGLEDGELAFDADAVVSSPPNLDLDAPGLLRLLR